MGGTDVNEHSLRAESRARMTRAVAAARAIVAMHPALAIRFSKVRIFSRQISIGMQTNLTRDADLA